MAYTKERKKEFVAQYVEWIDKSRAMVVANYKGLSMKDLDDLRSKIREVGGEFHIVKNTLVKRAFENAELPMPEGLLEGTTAIGFAFDAAPDLAKAMSEFAKETDFLVVKGGYLGNESIGPADITALAELPPLPVMRARLLGTILAPASKLVRTLAEPGRSLASVIQAYADKDKAEEAPAAA